MTIDDIAVKIAQTVLAEIPKDATNNQIKAAAKHGLELLYKGEYPRPQQTDNSVPDIQTFMQNEYILVDKINLLYSQLSTLLDKVNVLQNMLSKYQQLENVSMQSVNMSIESAKVDDTSVYITSDNIERMFQVEKIGSYFELFKPSYAEAKSEISLTYFIYRGDSAINDETLIDTGNPPATVAINKLRQYAVVRLTDDFVTSTREQLLSAWALQRFDINRDKVGAGINFKFDRPVRVSSIMFNIRSEHMKDMEIVSVVKDRRQVQCAKKMINNGGLYTVLTEFDSDEAKKITINMRFTPVSNLISFTGIVNTYSSGSGQINRVITDNAYMRNQT